MTLSTSFVRRGGSPMTGRLVDLDGTTGFIEKVGAGLWSNTNFTVAFRIKPHAIQSKTVFCLAAAGLTGVSEYCRIRTRQSGARMSLALETIDQSGVVAVSFASGLRIDPGVWSHVAMKDANGAVQFYINGAKDIASTTYTRPALAAMNRTMIGATIVSGVVTDFFDGEIDAGDAKFYASALSDADAAKLPNDHPMPTLTTSVFVNKTHRIPLNPVLAGADFSVAPRRDAHIVVNWSTVVRLAQKKRIPLNPIEALAEFSVRLSKSNLITDLSLPVVATWAVTTTRMRRIPLNPIAASATWSVATGKSAQIDLDPILITANFNVLTTGAKITTPTNEEFRFELRDSAGALKAILEGVESPVYSEDINQPSRLTFRMPAAAEGASLVDRTKEVWVRDMRDGSILDRCQVDDVSDESGDPAMIEVECYGILIRLAYEVVRGYSATGKPYRDVIIALLAFQNGANPITLASESSGFPATTWTGDFGFTSILDALTTIRKATGGYFRIRPGTRSLVWQSTITPNQANTRYIREGLNATRVVRKIDNRDIVTRLYATGAGEGSAEITLIDAGHPTLYLDADTIGTHGTIERHVKFVEITDPAVLLEAATRYVESHKNPVERITADVAEVIEE